MISLNREIDVCRSKIVWARRELERFENAYGLGTDQLDDANVDTANIPVKEMTQWREAAAAFEIWSARIHEYKDLYLAYKSNPAP